MDSFKMKRPKRAQRMTPKVILNMFPKKTIYIKKNEYGLYIYENFVLDEKTKQIVGKYLGDGKIELQLTEEDIEIAKEIKLWNL